jgi:hypothetical protein
VDLQQQLNPDSPASTLTKRIVCRVAILALLFAVAGFATAAKKSWYSPRSNPAHYLSISSKVKVSVAQVDLADTQFRVPVARVVVTQLIRRTNHPPIENAPPVPQIGVTVSLQHRSPPSAAA